MIDPPTIHSLAADSFVPTAIDEAAIRTSTSRMLSSTMKLLGSESADAKFL